MRSFSLGDGRTVELAINVGALRRSRDLARVDLADAFERDSTVLSSLQDPIKLCDVLYAICKPCLDRMGITAEQFGEALAGDVIADATAAMLEELVSFQPHPTQRTALGRVLTTAQRMTRKRMEEANGTLTEAAIEKAIGLACGPQSGDSPES